MTHDVVLSVGSNRVSCFHWWLLYRCISFV